MIVWLLIIISLPLILVRWLRWLAIVQQKEYRLDRLWVFLKSEEGTRDIARLIPSPADFSRTGLKRPVRTKRVAVVALISGLIILCVFATVFIHLNTLILTVIFVYIFMPLILLISCLPSTVVARLITRRTLKKAQQKLQSGGAKVIGIGGSYGKTSTKHLLAHLLAQKYTVFVTPKSHNTKYSVAHSIEQGYTNQQIAILEYGAYKKGEIATMTKWFPPVMAVETGFTLQHLSLFGTAENSLQAEAELIAALPVGQKVFCNCADAGAAEISRLGSLDNKAMVVPYTGPDSAVRLGLIAVSREGLLSFNWQRSYVQTALVGEHYVPNVQAAIAVSLELGLSEEQIVTGLRSFQPDASFVRSRTLASGALCIDDGGTSNPKGFTAIIELMRELPQPRKILLTAGIVDLGSETNQIHQDLAEQAVRVFQIVGYLGVDGHSQFASVFKENLLTEKERILELIASAKTDTVIVIEGKIPKWLVI